MQTGLTDKGARENEKQSLPEEAKAAAQVSASASPLDRKGIATLVHDFYRDVRADAVLSPVFAGAIPDDHWEAHLARLVDFWCTVMLGTQSFRGNVFGKHMELSGVTREHFTSWLGLWRQHTSRLFAPEIAGKFQEAALGIARTLHHGYFQEWPDFAPKPEFPIIRGNR